MGEFKVGDTVRTKKELEHIRGKIPEGTIGKKVANSNLENILIKMHGAEHEASVFEFGDMRLLALNSEVEKVETPKTEEASSEIYEYTFYFTTGKMPMKFRGKYVSADAEFEYYETEDDREIEVRSDSIEVKTSKRVR